MSEVDDITLALSSMSRKLGDQSVDKDQRQVRHTIDEFLSDSDAGQTLTAISSNMTRDATAHDMMCDIIHNLTPAGQMSSGAEAKAAFEVRGSSGRLRGGSGLFLFVRGPLTLT